MIFAVFFKGILLKHDEIRAKLNYECERWDKLYEVALKEMVGRQHFRVSIVAFLSLNEGGLEKFSSAMVVRGEWPTPVGEAASGDSEVEDILYFYLFQPHLQRRNWSY